MSMGGSGGGSQSIQQGACGMAEADKTGITAGLGKLADYVIDIGYEGGKGGGQLIAKGTPEEIVKNKKSFTAQFLKKELI